MKKLVKKKIIGVDGVIVGSAFVKHIIDDSLSNDEKIKKISLIAKEIKEKNKRINYADIKSGC